MHKVVVALIASLLAVPAVSAAGRKKSPASGMVRAALSPTAGNITSGHVEFSQVGSDVAVSAQISGLKPNARHGFHIHENGECGPDGQAAGGHFNPAGRMHGGPDSAERHAGDLGNVTADAQGFARVALKHSRLSLSGPHSIVGRAVVVHAEADDLTSQPAGNAGPRIACGVIGPAQE
ncbi:MAG: superoxide dismutase family protein [Elusimicrobiota bacterium]